MGYPSEYAELGETADHRFQLRARTLGDLAFPVPTFQPVGMNKPIALDLQPSGDSPVESPGNGYAWIDVCDADVMHANNRPVRCAGVMMTSDGAVFAARYFNGAQPFDLFLRTGNINRWGVNYAGHLYPVLDNAYQIGGPPTSRVTDIYLSGGSWGNPYAAYGHSLTKTIMNLQARVAALEAA